MIIQAPPFSFRTDGPPPIPSTLLNGFLGGWNLNGNGSDVLGLNNGTTINSPVFATGLGGQQALQTNGTDNTVVGYYQVNTFPSPQIRPTNAITVAVWVRMAAYPSPSARVFSDYDQSPLSSRWIAGYSDGSILYSVVARPGFTDAAVAIEGQTILGLGNWHLIGFSWDGTTINTYLDGSRRFSFSYSGTLNAGIANPLSIGTQFNAGQSIDGLQQNAYIWDRALTDSEWSQLFRRKLVNRYPFINYIPNPMENDLASFWSLNGSGQGDFGAGGQLDGTVTFPSGLFGELAASFTDSGSSPSINCGTLTPLPAGDFSMACWATLDSALPFFARWFCLADNGPSFWCDPSGVAGIVYGNNVAAYFGHTVTLNTPTHYAVSVTQSGGSTTIQPYINGVATAPTTIPTPAWSNNTVATIGSRFGRLERFPGRVQRAGYWLRALTASEIQELYNGSTYPFPP